MKDILVVPDFGYSIMEFLCILDTIPLLRTCKDLYQEYLPPVWRYQTFQPLWTDLALRKLPFTWWQGATFPQDWQQAGPNEFGQFSASYALDWRADIRVRSLTTRSTIPTGSEPIQLFEEPLALLDQTKVTTDPEFRGLLSDMALLWYFNAYFDLPGGDGGSTVHVGFIDTKKKLRVVVFCCCEYPVHRILGCSPPFDNFSSLKDTWHAAIAEQEERFRKEGRPPYVRGGDPHRDWECWMESVWKSGMKQDGHSIINSPELPQYPIARHLYEQHKDQPTSCPTEQWVVKCADGVFSWDPPTKEEPKEPKQTTKRRPWKMNGRQLKRYKKQLAKSQAAPVSPSQQTGFVIRKGWQ
eukprot:TRINITY_DN58988_c0_g2_i1.p1 TRINITY_DN58988_c0_g2~~TRINITY_DN58988_c0_g2_i1.p1  ORF type:complete len:376 (+),score=52.50 TRINITY_DN58988_c0_g2_i1:68-1129(+)